MNGDNDVVAAALDEQTAAATEFANELRATTLAIVADTIDAIADDFDQGAMHITLTGPDVAARLRRTSTLIRNTAPKETTTDG